MKGKNILVVGIGKSGIAASELLKKAGAEVTVYDNKTFSKDGEGAEKLEWAEKNGFKTFFGIAPNDVKKYDMLVVSPGVPLETPFIAEAADYGIDIIGELELAYRMGHGKFIAITGTNGKTTTTMLTGEIFKNAGRKTEVVGNVGVAVASIAAEADEDTWLVTECSSFQLDTTKTFRPVVSALLNITPDHLDRHKTMENYENAKGKVFANQQKTDYFVVNADDAPSMKQAQKCKARVVPFSRVKKLDFGACLDDGTIIIVNGSGERHSICKETELKIPGKHNLENALAAAAVSYFAGIPVDIIASTLRTFEGVEHRIEYCGTKNSVRFVNDSKGTNPDASIKAIEAIDGGIVLIAGGYDKGSQFDEFIKSFGGRVKAMVIMGKTGPKVKAAADAAGFTNTEMAENMRVAVNKAFSLAAPGNTVLLSPACASWDMYRCFEDRGDDFKKCFEELE